MTSAIIKRSVVVNGHKTSVSLENEFWEALRDMAEAQKVKLSVLVQQIERGRNNANLSSAIRVFVFEHYRRVFDGVAPRPMADKTLAA